MTTRKYSVLQEPSQEVHIKNQGRVGPEQPRNPENLILKVSEEHLKAKNISPKQAEVKD
jgi:homoserine kinase